MREGDKVVQKHIKYLGKDPEYEDIPPEYRDRVKLPCREEEEHGDRREFRDAVKEQERRFVERDRAWEGK